jgi:hypothetical protein
MDPVIAVGIWFDTFGTAPVAPKALYEPLWQLSQRLVVTTEWTNCPFEKVPVV